MRHSRLQLAAWVLTLTVTLEPCGAGELALRWSADPADPARAAVEITGLDAATLGTLEREITTPAQWQRILAVHAEPEGAKLDATLPSMAGSYKVSGGVISFRPLFPLGAGLSYQAVANPAHIPGNSGSTLSVRYRVPAAAAGISSAVAQIYPTASTLPENLLKFYVHFSAPMSRGGIYEHIHLLDGAGKAVELPFLELDEELWNPAMTRLTLFIDPGRIKRGVRPLEEIGPALVAGASFRLVIDSSCRDAAGHLLEKDFEKAFRVGPPEREAIDPSKWTVKTPAAESREPLVVEFHRALDHAIAQRVVRVTDAAGTAVDGTAQLENEEQTWKFVPAAPWARGNAYQIVVPTAIEDLAGNNIGKAFEVDLSSPEPGDGEASAVAASAKLPFNVR